jgi:hypothetical protein
MTAKRILLIAPNGAVVELPACPSRGHMQRAVAGDIEYVNVLDRVEKGEPIYTFMVVNEIGLLLDLPRNEKATEIFQRNVRAAFPASATPFADAHKAWLARHPPDSVITDLTPKHALERGYKDDPWIAGPAIYFEGHSVAECDELITAANKRAKQSRKATP